MTPRFSIGIDVINCVDTLKGNTYVFKILFLEESDVARVRLMQKQSPPLSNYLCLKKGTMYETIYCNHNICLGILMHHYYINSLYLNLILNNIQLSIYLLFSIFLIKMHGFFCT